MDKTGEKLNFGHCNNTNYYESLETRLLPERIQSRTIRYKIMLFGDPGVGKTSLISRYTEDTSLALDDYGEDMKTKLIDVDGKKVYLEIWDKIVDRLPSKTVADPFSCYYGAHGIILVYDISDERSFFNIHSSWLSEIEFHFSHEVVMMLVGNKTDLDISRRVEKATAAHLAEHEGMEYQETSAKTGVNVNEMFESLVHRIISKGKEADPEVIRINRPSQGHSSKCCGNA